MCPRGRPHVGRMLTDVAIMPTQLWQALHGTRPMDITGFDFFGLGARRREEEPEAAHEGESSSCSRGKVMRSPRISPAS